MAGPNLFPATPEPRSDACQLLADQADTSTIQRKMAIQMRLEKFDPARHQVEGKPATFDELRAANVACCEVVDLPGIGEAAFRWTSRDTPFERRVGTVFRKGNVSGGVYLRFMTDDGKPLDGWTAVEKVMFDATAAVATRMASGSLQ